tara:strand:+ start:307 stop:807 length:501 start_codon:yes stop_codon:yes gene_type:complete
MTPRLSQEDILSKLENCKRTHTDFVLIFEYYDSDTNSITTDKIECGWLWETATVNENNIPIEISIYDKGWDQDSVRMNIIDIVDCIPINTIVIDEYSHSEFNTVIDKLYESFCNQWDQANYKDAEVMMKHLYQIVKNRTRMIENNNSLYPDTNILPMYHPHHHHHS